ncbi:MAG: T9SS type A sorting domain-containing protein [Chitinophagaceae bacterium]|nr:T9SS type A sorting domain-containing protein [Chitinophagaceae bacterium]
MRKIFLVIAVFMAAKTNAQQIVRASGNVQIITTAGTKTVIDGGGITFLGTSKWTGTADSIYLVKTTATPTEGWLDSTAAGAMDVTSTGDVFFKGTNRQSFYGLTRFHNLTIRNAAGDTLLSSCEVRNNLRLDTGFVFTETGYGNDSLLVSNPAVNAISSTSSFGESWVNGRLSRTGNVVGTPAANFYLFPIGKTDSLYAPIKLSKVNGTTATWTAEYTYAAPFNRTNIFNPPLDHISEVEYWEVTSNNQFSSDDDAKISLSWRGRSYVSANAATRDSLVVAQYINRPPFIWDVPGLHAPGNTLGADSLFGYVNSNSPTNNYEYTERRFTLGTFSEFNALPVKLLYFTAIADGNKVRLNWEAANEQEVFKYEIEKSLSATNFSFLTSVNSRQMSQSAYIDFDNNPAIGWNYYRLKIIDKSGRFTYSPVRPVKFTKGQEQVKIFPVPATDILNVLLPSSYVNTATLLLYGIDGKFIATLKPSVNNVKMNVKPLTGGTYVLRIIKANGESETYPFIKQ